MPNLPLLPYAYVFRAFHEFNHAAECMYVFGVATPAVKAKVFHDFAQKHGLEKTRMARLIHTSAYVAPSAQLDFGVLAEPYTVISSQTKIGFGVNIKRGSTIGHHNNIGDYCDINPGVTLSGKVNVGMGTTIGSGAVVKDNVTIGANCIIGAGSVVTKNIPHNSVAYGNPCRVMKENEEWRI